MPFRKGHQAVFGMYPASTAAGEAFDQLKRAGFKSEDISILAPARPGDESVAYRRATKAPEGGAFGAASGAIVGSGLGWLAGIGALGIPGIGPFVAAGPLLSVFAGAGIGGAVGGIAGALVGLGVPEYEARRFEGYVRDGHVLMSIHVDDGSWADLARRILGDTGARDISIVDVAKAPTFLTGNARPITRADDYQFHK